MIASTLNHNLGPSTRLTDKQELFCYYIHTGMCNADAWVEAYGGHHSTRKTAIESASRLLRHPKVKYRLEDLKHESNRRAKISLEDHLKRLEELGMGAVEHKQYSAAINAEL